MFDDNKARRLDAAKEGRGDQGGKLKDQPILWDHCTLDQLLQYHAEIERRLPPLSLGHISVEREIILHFHTARALQAAVMSEEGVPANQRAQVANSVASAIKSLADLQIQIYTTERFKNIENLLIETLNELPEEQRKLFIDKYEGVLREKA